MKTKLIHFLLCVALVLSCLPVSALASDRIPATAGTRSDLAAAQSALHDVNGAKPKKNNNFQNRGMQNYIFYHALPVSSSLYENERGGFTRVEFQRELVLVEEYDRDFTLCANLEIQPELPLWGGFYNGANFNFLIYGKSNPEETDEAEVIRIVRYDKQWNRIDHASLYGINTKAPFDAGSLRCAEAGSTLVIHTAHKMYRSAKDGRNHQANLTITLNENTMEILETRHIVAFSGAGYCSHSFNQFALVDREGHLVTLDHGDAYPRAIMLSLYGNEPAEEVRLSRPSQVTSLFNFPGKTGDNYTSASVGGMTETDSGYMIAFNYTEESGEEAQFRRKVYLQNMSRANGPQEAVPISDSNASTPVIAPTGPNGGYILWNEYKDEELTDSLCYVRYENGQVTGSVRKAKGYLSDCAPVLSEGKLFWYVTDDNAPEAITFYSLDAAGTVNKTGILPDPDPSAPSDEDPTDEDPAAPDGSSGFWDVVPGAYYYDAVHWAVINGVTAGTTPFTFSPNRACTRAEAVTFLWRAKGSLHVELSSNPFADVAQGQYYEAAVSWAVAASITAGTGKNTFSPGVLCSRGQIVTFLWRMAGCPKSQAAPQFADVPASAYYAEAVSWAAEHGITAGTSETSFSPNSLCTRGQIVTFLHRYLAGQENLTPPQF